MVVATDHDELPQLEKLHERAKANGVPVRRMTPTEIAEVEPHVQGKAGLHVTSTGITDYWAVCHTLAMLARQQGAEVRLGTEVLSTHSRGNGRLIETTTGPIAAGVVVNCG